MDKAAFTKYRRITHEEIPIDYTAMNLVDDFTDGFGKEVSLWLVVRWLQAEARRTAGVGVGVARMLASRLKHELEFQQVPKPSRE